MLVDQLSNVLMNSRAAGPGGVERFMRFMTITCWDPACF